MYFITLSFLVLKIFTFYINDMLLFKYPFPGPKLNNLFPEQWMGRGGLTAWTAHSSVLFFKFLNFYLCRYLNSVYLNGIQSQGANTTYKYSTIEPYWAIHKETSSQENITQCPAQSGKIVSQTQQMYSDWQVIALFLLFILYEAWCWIN